MDTQQDIRTALAHVLWIGGTPGAGKTSLTDMLAQKYGLQIYHQDRMMWNHFERQQAAGNTKVIESFAQSVDERWLVPTPEVLMQNTITAWTDNFPLIIEDLLEMPEAPLVIAEGPGLWPECVAPLLSALHQGIWLVPTDEFGAMIQRRRHEEFRQILLNGYDPSRGTSMFAASNPEKALNNLIARNQLLTRYNKQQAEIHGLTVHEVDGNRSLEETMIIIEMHFAQYLREPDQAS